MKGIKTMILKIQMHGIIKKIACLLLALIVTVNCLWVEPQETKATGLELAFGTLTLGQVLTGIGLSAGVTFAVADLVTGGPTINDLVNQGVVSYTDPTNAATFDWDPLRYTEVYGTNTAPSTIITTQMSASDTFNAIDMGRTIGQAAIDGTISYIQSAYESLCHSIDLVVDRACTFPRSNYNSYPIIPSGYMPYSFYFTSSREYRIIAVPSDCILSLREDTNTFNFYGARTSTEQYHRYYEYLWYTDHYSEINGGTFYEDYDKDTSQYYYSRAFGPARAYGNFFYYKNLTHAEIMSKLANPVTYNPYDNVYNPDGGIYNKDAVYTPIAVNGTTIRIPSVQDYNNFVGEVTDPTNNRPAVVTPFVNAHVIPFTAPTTAPEPTAAPEPTQAPEPTSPAIVPPVPDKPTLPDQPNWDPSTDPGTEGNPNPVVDPDRLPEGLPEAGPVKDPNTDVSLDEGDSANLNDYKLDANWQSVFPFCIPFDLYKMYQMINAPRQAPYFKGNFKYGNNTQEVIIDLSPFDPVASVMRKLELIAFIIALAVGTRKLIGALG